MVLRPSVDEQLCFVLMPFHGHFPEYFRGILVPAAEAAGLKALKADDIYGTAPIITDIWDSIWKERIVIADVTGKNPNVNYELGLCHALGVPTILITQNMDDVPFDYKHRRCIPYDTQSYDWQASLREKITRTIQAVLSGTATADYLTWPYDTELLNIESDSPRFVSAEDAREFVARGIQQARDTLYLALGIHGSSVSVSSAFSGNTSQRGGFAIANALSSANPLIQLGIDEMQAVTRETALELGDGTKGAGLIFAELVLKGFSELKRGAILRELIHEMDIAVEAAVDYVDTLASPVNTEAQVDGVALTASLGEGLSGSIVTEATRRAGKDGVVLVEESGSVETTLSVREGMYFERGFVTDRFVTDQAQQLAILENCHILISAETVRSMHQLLPTMEQVARAHESLLVIAPDLEAEPLETLAINAQKQLIVCAAVKTPAPASRPEVLEDIAVSTGGIVFRFASQLSDARMQQLGFAKRVEISRDGTWIVGGRSNEQMLASRAAGIRQQLSVSKNDREMEYLQERLAKLTGAVCVIHVGGASTADRDERKYRITSALHSVRSAIAGGVVPGGGSSLWRAHLKLPEQGATLLMEALTAPIYGQIKNARLPVDPIVEELIKHADDPQFGFNARKLIVENIVEAGVLDSATITKRQLQIAFGHARKVLQTGGWDVSHFQNRSTAH